MVNEIVTSRIEQAQAGLPQAVQASDGAHFRMLLSLISSNESYGYQRGAEAEFDVGLTQPQRSRYVSPDQLYSAPVVDRINRSLHDGLLGEMAYALAWVDTQANIPRSQQYNSPISAYSEPAQTF